MGVPIVTPTRIVLLAAVVGAAAVVAGLAGQFGPWWALIVGGTFTLAAAVLLYDPESRKPGNPR